MSHIWMSRVAYCWGGQEILESREVVVLSQIADTQGALDIAVKRVAELERFVCIYVCIHIYV